MVLLIVTDNKQEKFSEREVATDCLMNVFLQVFDGFLCLVTNKCCLMVFQESQNKTDLL